MLQRIAREEFNPGRRECSFRFDQDEIQASAVCLNLHATVRRPHFGCCHALISASSTHPRSRAARRARPYENGDHVPQTHQKSEAILRSARMLRTALRARLMSAKPLTGREGRIAGGPSRVKSDV